MEHPLAHNYDVTSVEIYPLIALPIAMALQIGECGKAKTK